YPELPLFLLVILLELGHNRLILSRQIPQLRLELPHLEFEVEREVVLGGALQPTSDRQEDVNCHVAADHVHPPGLVSGIAPSVSSRYPLEKRHVQAQEAAAGQAR